ncbi:hypothetical protein [Victivallis vadensis]|uniref:hypothetical protein n=1 Tax=Victivallis vadensis TaxID=172901 RepID=UPI00307DDCA6
MSIESVLSRQAIPAAAQKDHWLLSDYPKRDATGVISQLHYCKNLPLAAIFCLEYLALLLNVPIPSKLIRFFRSAPPTILNSNYFWMLSRYPAIQISLFHIAGLPPLPDRFQVAFENALLAAYS